MYVPANIGASVVTIPVAVFKYSTVASPCLDNVYSTSTDTPFSYTLVNLSEFSIVIVDSAFLISKFAVAVAGS